MTQTAKYESLVTSEHNQRPNFIATLDAVAGAAKGARLLMGAFTQAYDLDTAIGVQLDAVGQWVGRSRKIATPISGVYFSFDTTGVGFDQGVWQGPFDPSAGVVSLDDDTYRLLLRAKIAANNWDGTIDGAINALDQVFQPYGVTFAIQDNDDMTMLMTITGVLPSALFESLFGGGYIPLRPMGVQCTYNVVSVGVTAAFGFDTSTSYVQGWDRGSWVVPI